MVRAPPPTVNNYDFVSLIYPGLVCRTLLEDTKPGRILPHPLTPKNDGYISDLCASLSAFIFTMGQNLGSAIKLDYKTIPMYYLLSWATKSFYSVANLLLLFGVIELVLPVLSSGLATEIVWWALSVV